jgi:3-phenylpropionate/trans-cinnamate dioxygenase ferredoxin subunit
MNNYRELPDDQLEFVVVAEVDELANGERLFLEVDGMPIAVFNVAGKYFAIEDICSHDQGSVAEGEIIDHSIECPRHGARFDLNSGKALSMPAVVDIAAYPVRVEGQNLLVGFPIETS